jgi:L-asparaginase II
VLCVADLENAVGLALKVEDGRKRAVGPAAIEVLEALGLLDGSARGPLSAHRVGPVSNTREEVVGEVRASVRLEGDG